MDGLFDVRALPPHGLEFSGQLLPGLAAHVAPDDSVTLPFTVAGGVLGGRRGDLLEPLLTVLFPALLLRLGEVFERAAEAPPAGDFADHAGPPMRRFLTSASSSLTASQPSLRDTS